MDQSYGNVTFIPFPSCTDRCIISMHLNSSSSNPVQVLSKKLSWENGGTFNHPKNAWGAYLFSRVQTPITSKACVAGKHAEIQYKHLQHGTRTRDPRVHPPGRDDNLNEVQRASERLTLYTLCWRRAFFVEILHTVKDLSDSQRTSIHNN